MNATPTAELKFVDGKLHQLFMVHDEHGSSRPEWRSVPSESTAAVITDEEIGIGLTSAEDEEALHL